MATKNLWGEVKDRLSKGRRVDAIVTTVDGKEARGNVIDVVEGWVKLERGISVFWLNMDAIVTWELEPDGQ
jgi:hypothetical protein